MSSTALNRRELLASAAATGLLAGCAVGPPPEPTYTPPSADGPFPYRPPVPPQPATLPKPPDTFFLAPPAPVYPHFADSAAIVDQARRISDALAGYIDAWFAGRVPAEIPAAFIPPGTNPANYRTLRLVRFEDVRPERLWGVRPARQVVSGSLLGGHPDPGATYLVNPSLFAPFGTKLVVEGEFPHARFFDIQVSPPFDPMNYRYDGIIGIGEVPIVDADIEPLAGHTNPFRPGARRDAAKRGYRVEWELAIGDAVALNPAFRPPNFRGRGNRRVGAALAYQGAWGVPGSGGHGRGVWDFGQVWVRYYAPDRPTGELGGVPLPTMHYQLADGRRFFIESDVREWAASISKPAKLRSTSTPPKREWADEGWVKETGIFRSIMSGLAGGLGASGEYVRQIDRGVASHGADLPPPRNYEQACTGCTYIDYMVRSMSCAEGHVVVLTGTMPTFPDTRDGSTVFPRSADMRYCSLVGYNIPEGLDFIGALLGGSASGVAQHAIHDDEFVLASDRSYVLALSRPGDRPRNAGEANGVTWRDWGNAGLVGWTWRWLTVGPEWQSRRLPTADRIGYNADPAEPGYDPDLIGRNRPGAMGPFHPVVHYLTTAEFERLGDRVRAGEVPAWRA